MAKWDLSKLNNQQANELSTIVITDSVEHEDGSATYTFDMDDASQKKITELGLEFILTCAAYGLDIQDALEDIRWAGEQRELAKKIDGPYTADQVGDILK
jgi:hypothetical protein